MRTNYNVQVGQTWRLSDPRRLSLFQVVDVHGNVGPFLGPAVTVRPIYPKGPDRWTVFEPFITTGSKGYTRVS